MKLIIKLRNVFEHRIILGRTQCSFAYTYTQNKVELTKKVRGTIVGIVSNKKRISLLIRQKGGTLSNRYWKDVVILS